MIKHSEIDGGYIPKFKSIATILIIVGLVYNFFTLNEYRLNELELNRKIQHQKNLIDSLRKIDVALSKIIYKNKLENKCGVKIPEKVPYEHLKLIVDESKKNLIPVRISVRMIYKESKFNAYALSSAGAIGYTQTMPVTFKGYAIKINLNTKNSPENNIKVGLFYLSSLHKIWRRKGYNEVDSWKLALSSYNTGIGKVGVNPIYFISKSSYTNKYSTFILS